MNSLDSLFNNIATTIDHQIRLDYENKYFEYRQTEPSDNFMLEIFDVILISQYSSLAIQCLTKDIQINKNKSVLSRVSNIDQLNTKMIEILNYMAKTQDEELTTIIAHYVFLVDYQFVEVFQFLSQGFNSNICDIQKICFRLLSQLAINPQQLFQSSTFDFLQILAQGLNNPDISCYAIETIYNLVASIAQLDNQQIIADDQLASMVKAATSKQLELTSISQIQTVIDILIEVTKEQPEIFLSSLLELQQFIDQIVKSQQQDILTTGLVLVQNLISQYQYFQNVDFVVNIINSLIVLISGQINDETLQLACKNFIKFFSEQLSLEQCLGILLQYQSQPRVFLLILSCLNVQQRKTRTFLKIVMPILINISCSDNTEVLYFLEAVTNCFALFESKIIKYADHLFNKAISVAQQTNIKELTTVAINYMQVQKADNYCEFFRSIIDSALNCEDIFIKETGFCLLKSLSDGINQQNLQIIYKTSYELVFQQFFGISEQLQDISFIKNHQFLLSNIISVVGDMIEFGDMLETNMLQNVYKQLVNLLQITLSIQNGEIFEAITESIIQLSSKFGNLFDQFGEILINILQNISSIPSINLSDTIKYEGDIIFNDDICQIQQNTLRLIVQILSYSPSQFKYYIQQIATEAKKIEAVNSDMTEVQLQSLIMLINVVGLQDQVSIYDILNNYLLFSGDITTKSLPDLSAYLQGLEIGIKCYLNYIDITKTEQDFLFLNQINEKLNESISVIQRMNPEDQEVVIEHLGFALQAFLDLPGDDVIVQYIQPFIQQHLKQYYEPLERFYFFEVLKILEKLFVRFDHDTAYAFLNQVWQVKPSDILSLAPVLDLTSSYFDRYSKELDSFQLQTIATSYQQLQQLHEQEEIDEDHDLLIVNIYYLLEAHQNNCNLDLINQVQVTESEPFARFCRLIGARPELRNRYEAVVQKHWSVLTPEVQSIFQ